MGIFGSKNKFKKTPEMPQNLPPIIPSNTQKTEDNNLAKMRRQLYHDAPTFILNNLLLSIQFFNNYEKDIADLRMSNISSKENKINTDLSKEQKHCLMPDTLHALIDTNVCFQPKHGAAKYYTETLHRQRILVAYDNIEVRNPSETAEYSSALDGPIYKCVIEGTELRGYVQLKLKEIEVKRKMSNPNNPEKIIEKKEIIKIDDNADEIVNEENNSDDVDGNESNLNDDVFVDSPIPLPNEKQPLIRQLSLSKQQMIIQKIPEESDYGYSTITNHYTAKPLKQNQIDTTDSGKASSSLTNIIRLPSNCITSVQVKVYRDKIEEEEEKRKLREKYPDKNEFRRQMMLRQKHKLYNKIVYLNSIAFHDYFGDTFPQYIGKKLGFTQKHIQFAVMQSAIIYIDVIDKETKHVTNYEVIPTVTSSWPDEAFEWSLRTRPVIQDAKTQTAYCWPTPGMISRVKSFPSYIYPIGFYPKRGENINRDLQWRLQFPVAERFLESHLHHAQVRCYLITLTYFKSFIESKDNKLGLTADHIRTHLFWECERDYVRWPENRLGEKMIVFLRNLQRHLAYRELPDYFIPTRNLFENIPENRLMIAHRKILDILENPVMYTLRALRNLKYRKDSFYPMLDYKRLYTILTSSNNNILQMINPILAMTNTELDESSSSGDELDPEQRWFRDAYRERQEEKEIEKKKKERKRRISSDSINTEIQPVRVMDTMQQMFVLKLFAEHFIEMARKSNEFNNPHQGLMYLQQAKNLNTLLNEMPSGQEDSIEYFSHISKVEESLKITLAQEENVPKLPSRKGQSQSYRNIKNTDFVNEPKASTTSSNYVNVDEILEKSKLTEIENHEKLKQKQHFNTREEEQIKDTAVESQTEIGKHNKIDIDQNRKKSEEKSFENVLIVQVDVHSSNKKQATSNENNSVTLKFDDNEESGKNKKDVSKMNIAEKNKSVHDEIILNDDYITRLNSGSKNSVNEIENNSNQNNLGISDLNKEPNKTNSTKSSMSLSKNPTVNEINKNQEEIAVSDDYLARLNSNKRTEVYQDIENNSRRKHPRKNVAPKDEHPNSSINEKLNEINQKFDENNHFEILNESNNSTILSSKADTLSKIKRIQEEITLNDDYLAVLNSNKRKEEDNQDIVIENKSEKDILQKAPTKNDVYLTHLNSKSNENLNEIQQNINIETDQKNQNKTLIPPNTRQEVITLHDEYSSRLNYGNTKCLNESSPDDDVIIANKLDSRIILRSNSGQTRSNVNSIILREDSEEFECTEL